MRDSALRRYVFPDWATLPPGESLTVYVGAGTDTWTEFFWDQRKPIFENPTGGERAMGDGAYLFDPQGDLRACDDLSVPRSPAPTPTRAP